MHPDDGAIQAQAQTQTLEDELVEIARLECGLHAQFLVRVARYAASEAYRADGARDLAEWLARRFAMAPYRARETARVALSLSSLPRIFAAYAEGELSWDQLRALTRYATPETDEELAVKARGLSLSSIEAAARRARTKSADEARREHQQNWLTMYRRGESLTLKGELFGEWAARVEKAIERSLSRQPRPPQGHLPEPFDHRLAQALVEVCGSASATDPDPDRATVVVHADMEALLRDDGVGDVEGYTLSSETLRRLCCDARRQEVLEVGGIPVGIGDISRTVPPSLLRVLKARDRGCRFPGCSRRRWVHAHHRWHWARGGPTDLGNLVLLCSYHHHFVHEGGWSIDGDPHDELRFRRPAGDRLEVGLAA